MICIKDCSFKEEKTVLLWDFVFSEAGVDSLEKQWVDGQMIMDGLINAWMSAMERWMVGWLDEQVMDDGKGFKNKDPDPCFEGHAWLKSIFSHLI